MKKYLKSFFVKEDGVETIEFIGVLAVGAGLIAAIAGIAGAMNSRVTGAQTSIDQSLDKALQQAGTNGDGKPPVGQYGGNPGDGRT